MEVITDKQFKALKDFRPNTILTASSLEYKISQLLKHNEFIVNEFGGDKLDLDLDLKFTKMKINTFKKIHKRYNNSIVDLSCICDDGYPTELELIQCVNDVHHNAKQLLVCFELYYGFSIYKKAIEINLNK